MRHWKLIGAILALLAEVVLQLSGYQNVTLAVILALIMAGLLLWSAWPMTKRIRFQTPVKLTRGQGDAATQHGQELTQEHIVERLSFIQKLKATEDQLVKNIHFNTPESVAHFFTKFCEEPDVRRIVQPDIMATTAVRLITERFHILTFQSLEHQERGKKLTASTISDDSISYECDKISQAVREYRHIVDEWMKFMEALAVKGIPKFWEKAPWSENIHRKLADDYDELMRLVKDLRNATPRAFQNLLPKDDEITKFPRQSLYS